MSMSCSPRRAVRLLLLCGLSACSGLLGPQEPLPVRWFEPALPAVETAPPVPGAPELRLAPVIGARRLRERVVWRHSEVEYDYHALWRWTEDPAQVVQRALSAALFERGLARRSTRADAATLLVELERFELSTESGPRASLAWRARLEGPDGRTLLERRMTASTPLEAAEPEALARELGALTAQLADELAGLVLAMPRPSR